MSAPAYARTYNQDHIARKYIPGKRRISIYWTWSYPWDALREWLKRPGACLLLAPHHDVGFTDDMKQRQMEYLHHGDRLVPRQQRFGQYTRSLMEGLGVPVHNTYGLRPAVVKGTTETAP